MKIREIEKFLISQSKVFIYSLVETKEILYKAFSKLDNIEIEYFFPTKNDQRDTVYKSFKLGKIASSQDS